MENNLDYKRQITEKLKDLSDSFSNRDLRAALALFSLDSKVVFIGSEEGEVAVGTDELESKIEQLFARRESYSWEWSELTIEVREGLAWAVMKAVISVKKDGQSEVEKYPYRTTFIFEKNKNDWSIIHFHGSEPAD